jgi:hypothetical protein
MSNCSRHSYKGNNNEYDDLIDHRYSHAILTAFLYKTNIAKSSIYL